MATIKSLELFAGAGGLALGMAQAGFRHAAVVEYNKDACATLRENKARKVEHVSQWPIVEKDVREFDYKPYADKVDLVAGGPPCQPFSIGGKHRGCQDSRNMFPQLIRAVREVRPKAVLVENVRGLVRRSFARYFEYILLSLTYPDIVASADEEWTSHLARLEKYHTQGRPDGLHYRLVFQCLNAASFGVPQRRERVFMVALRSDLHAEWSFPEPTHSMDKLLYDQWITGTYWERHQVAAKNRPHVSPRYSRRIQQLESAGAPPGGHACLTIRDAIADLPEPRVKGSGIPNHILIPGARSYPGHTGSCLDEPAKTLKAGDHGVPGGENTLAHPNGHVRYLTVRESARLQTFPDDFLFSSSWTESMRQLGNAVPVHLAKTVAQHLKTTLKGARTTP